MNDNHNKEFVDDDSLSSTSSTKEKSLHYSSRFEFEKYINEFMRCTISMENVEMRHYDNNASLNRVRSRSFLDLLQVRLKTFFKINGKQKSKDRMNTNYCDDNAYKCTEEK